jgi:hypothetical protein
VIYYVALCCEVAVVLTSSAATIFLMTFVIHVFFNWPYMMRLVERELALKRQYQHLKDQLSDLQRQHSQTEGRWDEARADYRDVLRLVDIMVASPAGIRAVLEAYLKKLGTLSLCVCETERCYIFYNVEVLRPFCGGLCSDYTDLV